MKKEVFDTIDTKLLKNFEIIKKVGQGAFGQVWKVKNKKTGNVCALKKIYQAFKSPNSSQRTYREIKYLQKLEHPGIVKLHGWYRATSDAEVYLQLEFMEADLCLALRNGVLKPIHKHYIFYQLANALKYLHSAELIHRDIKPTNILVNQTCQAKLCDFGLIRSLSRDSTKEALVMTEKVATRWYRAPEILLGSRSYGKAVDVWSIGCVLAEMILERPLFQGSSAIDQMQKVFQVTGLPSEKDFEFVQNETTLKVIKSLKINERKTLRSILNTEDANLIDLLEQILQLNPEKRPTADQILTHPFISKFRGRLQEKGATFPLKILYESKLLNPDDYKNLLFCQLQEKDSPVIKAKHKNSPDSSTGEDSGMNNMIYRTMPQMSRNAFMNDIPLQKYEKKSPMQTSYLNQKGFSPFGGKKDVSPLRGIPREDKSPNEKRSPSFLANKKKQQNLTPEKVEMEKDKKTNLKRTLTFPLRISPSKSQSKKQQEKSTQQIKGITSDSWNLQKNRKEVGEPRANQEGPQQKFPTSPIFNNAKVDIFSSLGLGRANLKIEKKPSLTFMAEAEIRGFPMGTTPPKSSFHNLVRTVTPTKQETPQTSTKSPMIKLPVKQGLTFTAPPNRRGSPTSATLKVNFPSTPPTPTSDKKVD